MIQVKEFPLITANNPHYYTSEEEEQLKFTILDLAIKLLSPQGCCIAQVRRLLMSGCGSVLFYRATGLFVPNH